MFQQIVEVSFDLTSLEGCRIGIVIILRNGAMNRSFVNRFRLFGTGRGSMVAIVVVVVVVVVGGGGVVAGMCFGFGGS